ncbi:MAG: hypothetical protein IJI14_13405 [Anaerolineaceae bacterium]|nr:hypothetical protein [Anaerolineaceae bacterium]
MMNNDLFYTCSLIEYIGRLKKQRRGDVVSKLGTDSLSRIMEYADVLHSDSIDHVAEEYSNITGISEGSFDNIAACRYDVPGYWDIGKVYTRLIEDVSPDNLLKGLESVYGSWLSDAISNYNSDLYYQPRDYLKECYLAGEILP